MRPGKQLQEIIKNKFRTLFSTQAQVLLFSSRANNNERGGDIDLLMGLDYPIKETLKKNLLIESARGIHSEPGNEKQYCI